MLNRGETFWVQMEEGASELDDQEVDDNDDDPDDEEHGVREEVFADVDFVVDLPSGDHVHNLEPDEEVEDEGHMTRIISINGITLVNHLVKVVSIDLVEPAGEHHVVDLDVSTWDFQSAALSVLGEAQLLIRLRNHVFSAEEENKQDYHLEERHVDDVLGHLAGDDEVILVLRIAQQQGVTGLLSGEGQRGERVHDHVDPEELNSLQRGLLEQDSTDDGEDQGVHIDGQLELEETLDVIIDISTPRASFDDRSETIINNDNVSSLLAHSSTSLTHTEADICLGKGHSIIGSISSYSHDLFH